MNRVDDRRRELIWARAFTEPGRWNALIISVIVLGVIWTFASIASTITSLQKCAARRLMHTHV